MHSSTRLDIHPWLTGSEILGTTRMHEGRLDDAVGGGLQVITEFVPNISLEIVNIKNWAAI